MEEKKKIVKRAALILFCVGLIFLGFLCFFSAKWYIREFGDTGFDSVLYTLFSEKGGTDRAVIISYLKHALFPAVLAGLLVSVLLWKRIGILAGIAPEKGLYPIRKKYAALLSSVLSCCLLVDAAATVDLPSYIAYVSQQSEIYQEEYVDPAKAEITFPQEKRNLIYIYLESLENCFMSEEDGGALEHNSMPELTQLARENINFSHTDGLGGFHNMTGASWTIGAMVAHTAGIPLKVPVGVDRNEYGQDAFLPGVRGLSDVLHENGYYQALMVGSDANFGGRAPYYTQHGLDEVFDIFTAREVGIVPPGYYVFWGMEDFHLFDFAKQELPKLAEREEPFAFTLLTVDTHRPNGFVCE